jgi:hypothetical protein
MESNAETTFFSYSRTDSDFVKQLAKDLRSAGARVWLDQLDIKPGAHWDSAIEKALNESKHLIVVLSPASVSSNNVMDEVSFALDNGKSIIPVLINDCSIPFRLRRLQYIDFTGDHQQGLSQLVAVLGRQAVQSPDNQNMQTGFKGNNAAQNTGVSEQKSSGAVEATQNSRSESTGEADIRSGQHWQQGRGDATLQEEAPGDRNNKKRKPNYLLIGAAAVVCILLVWMLVDPPWANKNETDPQTAGMSDITEEDTTQQEQASSAEPLAVGSLHEGGYIFSLDEAGKSGLIAAPSDITDATFQDAVKASDNETAFNELIKACEANKPNGGDWRLPTIEELRFLNEKKDSIPALDSTGGCVEKPYSSFYYSATKKQDGQLRGICFQDGTEQWTHIEGGRVRLVRKF